MQLREVRVHNVRSYAEARLPLGPGTTLIVGDVGAGKTSLLYSIEMALFGFAVVDPAYLVRHGAPEAEVAVVLGDAEHRYELRRRFRRKTRRGRQVFEGGELSYSVDGHRTQFSTTELRRQVIDLLGFPDNPNPRSPSDLWRWAIYVPQESMRAVLGDAPEERLESVRKALGLEEYRTAAENSAILATELRRQAASAEELALSLAPALARRGSLEQSIGALTGALAAARRDEAERRTEVESAERSEQEIERVRRTAAVLEAELGANRAESDRLASDRTERVARRQRLAEAGASAPTPGEDEADRAAIDAAEREVATAEVELERLRLARERVAADQRHAAAREATAASLARERQRRQELVEREQGELRRLQAELDRALREGPRHEPPAPTPRSLGDIQGELSASQARRGATIAAVSTAQAALSDLQHLLDEGTCPTCGQRVDPERFAQHRAEGEAQLNHARAEDDATAHRLDELEQERASRERFERAHLAWEAAESRRATLRSAVDAGASRLQQLRGPTDPVEQPTGPDAEDPVHGVVRLAEESERLERDRRAVDESRRAATAARDARRHAMEQRVRRREAAAAAAQESALLASELDRLERRIAELGASRERLARERRDLEPVLASEAGVRESVRRAREALGRWREQVVRQETELARQREELVQVAETEQRHVALQAEAAELQALGRWFNETFPETVLGLEHRLLARAQGEFERHLSRFFQLLVEDPSMVARCGTSFAPFVEVEGEETPADALSGGERTALALAFRLALGLVVRAAGRLRLDTLILDEPTEGFSPEQVGRLGELLREIGLGQVVIVSHEPGLAAAADRTLRVQKQGGESRLIDLADEAPDPAPRRATPRRRPTSLDATVP